MKMKLREVQTRMQNLVRFGTKTFPSRLSFAIACNLETLQEEAVHMEMERKKLCERYAEKDDKGKPVMADSVVNGTTTKEYQMSAENRRLFEEEYRVLMDTEVDITVRTVKHEVIEQCEKTERYDLLTVGELMTLAFMLEE